MPCGGCGQNQHAITKYRLLAPDGVIRDDYDTIDAARGANKEYYAGNGVIRTVRVPKPVSGPTPAR